MWVMLKFMKQKCDKMVMKDENELYQSQWNLLHHQTKKRIKGHNVRFWACFIIFNITNTGPFYVLFCTQSVFCNFEEHLSECSITARHYRHIPLECSFTSQTSVSECHNTTP